MKPRVLLFQMSLLGSLFMLLLPNSSQAQTQMEDAFGRSMGFVSDSFIGVMDDVPASFKPKSLEDFTAYLPANYNLEPVKRAYDTVLLYSSDYIETNGEAAFVEDHFNPGESESSYGPCFSEYLHGEFTVMVGFVNCNASSEGAEAVDCLVTHIAREQILVSQFKDCLKKSY